MNQLPDSLVRFGTELESAIRREQEAQATDRSHGRGSSIRRRPGRMVLAIAVLAGAAATALFVSAPWQRTPGFLERAQAALTSTEPSILHMEWETRFGSNRANCVRPEEIWIDQTPPHRYRFLADLPRFLTGAGARQPVCERDTLSEVGGTLGALNTLEFRPPNTLIRVHLKTVFPVDPVADLREAIGADRAHDEGTTELDGRTVRRIRLDPPSSCPDAFPDCPRQPSYTYVDPETFYPVVMEGPGFVRSRAVQLTIRYLEFEYLPRTAENLKLTDIRAQHPDAIGP